MRFKIAARRYALQITPGPLVFEEKECLGCCLQADQLLLIAADCPVRDRLRILLRELLRAWTFEVGEPATVGAWLDLGATVLQGTINDLNMQGGEMALMSMVSGESPEPAAARSGLSTSRQCAVCESTVAGGSVAWRPSTPPGAVELRIYCEHCNQTQIWQEGQSARGIPNAIPISEPRFERGDKTGLAQPGLSR